MATRGTRSGGSAAASSADKWTLLDLRVKVVELRLAAYRQEGRVADLLREAASMLEQAVVSLEVEKISSPTALRVASNPLGELERPNLPRGFPPEVRGTPPACPPPKESTP